ncbi:hypothetical protein PIROE2DRAFT_14763 [Piromyces sp. E2]|nr:hypothetical protein PIROE2DRAFT_14763 [Piromyces sp. E2]|eukprot:OUM59647.1 hypothetical protein PIROE2DRAFT_14763 [Piromyces sp. E2]
MLKNLYIIFLIIYATISLALPLQENENNSLVNTEISKKDSNLYRENTYVSDDEETLVENLDFSESDDEILDVTIEINGNNSTNNDTYVEKPTSIDIDVDFENFNFTSIWSYTPEQLETLTDKIIAYKKQAVEEVINIPDEECSFESVVAPYIRKTENEISKVSGIISYIKNVSPSKDLRNASTKCSSKLNEFKIDNDNKKILYHKVEQVIKNIENGKFKAPEHFEDKKLLEQFYRSLGSSGLSQEDENKLSQLRKEMNNEIDEFIRCLNEDESYIVFTKEELKGLSSDFMESLEMINEDGKEGYIVNLDYLNNGDILSNAVNEDTRERMLRAYDQRCKPNSERLKNIVNIRLQIANIYGYQSHAERVLKDKMAKSPKYVIEFLEDLKERLQPLAKKEIQTLLELKKIEKEKLNEPFDGIIHDWDQDYYSGILLEQNYSLRMDKISQYFPVNEVTTEMLKIYEELFSLKCIEVKDAITYHPDVRLIEVYDKKTDDLLGMFYLDLFPRDGKYDDFASYGLGNAYEKEDGSRTFSLGAMVNTFSKPTSTKPSLLSHEEVVTYFHELGHVFHQICSETKWARYNGWNVVADFVEGPSQLLENWCWEPEILKRLSHHYQDYNKRLPDDLIQSIVNSRNVNSAIDNLVQVFYSLVDMKIHSIETVDNNMDIDKLYSDLQKEIVMIETVDNAWPIGNFDHLVDGYDALYYGYLYSQVFSSDMYISQFKKNGILNPEVGERYRNIVLKNGSAVDALDLIKEFLGREPNNEAFIKTLIN